ncbi:MAG: IS110 family transposase [Dehalococcoidia bacterium]|nr:IS110 family transposase [Dehalococcoidia bacterium]
MESESAQLVAGIDLGDWWSHIAVVDGVGELVREGRLLQQVPGVGPLTALTFILVVDDPSRFRRSRDVAAYLGLVPRQRQSGERDPQLGITKSGDRYLRSLLVESANYILSSRCKETDLKRWGLAHL